MDALALKTRAIAQVQVLAQAWEQLQSTWSEIQAIGDERRDTLDRMLCDHYPFTGSFDDLAIEVADWCKAVTSYDIKPEQPVQDEGKIYLFVGGYYRGEFDGSDQAALRACELLKIDPTAMKNSGEGWADYICNEFDNNNQEVEIIHEADYRFHQGDHHPAGRRDLNEHCKGKDEIMAMSSHGNFMFDANTGVVLSTNLGDEFGDLPVSVNIWEWQRTYPKECMPDNIDILDLGYMTAKGYEEPEHSWRQERTLMQQED